MRICLVVADDPVFKPQVFCRILLKRGGDVCGVAEVGIARIACTNCHPSKLPKYRGTWPIFVAMLDGEATIDGTAHTITARIGSGIILCQKEFAASKYHSFLDKYAYVHELYPDVILEALDPIERSEISGCTQVPVDAP